MVLGWSCPRSDGPAAGLCCVPPNTYTRTSGGSSASRSPRGSVTTSEPLRCQYSEEVSRCITFGTAPAARARRRMPSRRPLNGSTSSP